MIYMLTQELMTGRNIGTKDRCWSESDLQNIQNNKAILSNYELPKWHEANSLMMNVTEEEIPLNESNDQISKQSPVDRPKWNTVSKNRSVNTIYNSKTNNINQLRRGWDLELKKRRRHKLPPLKEKPTEPTVSPSPLAIEYHHDQTHNNDYATTSSIPSSRALVLSRRTHDNQLSLETPRSQRPIQQEWYDEFNKTQIQQNTDGRQSMVSNTPRDQWTMRSSSRNSQTSMMSAQLLDSSIRTNRATELRLSRDLEEHHQHSHTVQQSMPLEIRGFQLEGSSLTVPDHATIRPLSNVNYRWSERVRHHRLYPWSALHSHITSSRNSGLLPIEEFRNSPSEMKAIQMPPLLLEE